GKAASPGGAPDMRVPTKVVHIASIALLLAVGEAGHARWQGPFAETTARATTLPLRAGDASFHVTRSSDYASIAKSGPCAALRVDETSDGWGGIRYVLLLSLLWAIVAPYELAGASLLASVGGATALIYALNALRLALVSAFVFGMLAAVPT